MEDIIVIVILYTLYLLKRTNIQLLHSKHIINLKCKISMVYTVIPYSSLKGQDLVIYYLGKKPHQLQEIFIAIRISVGFENI